MDLQRTRLILFAAIVLLAGCRAGKSTESASPASPPSSPPTLARIHWLGMKQISGETNAAHWMAIWNLPESEKLERQTLDKLSLALWPLLHRSIDTNAAVCFRPLLDDLVEEESCLEIRQASNQPDELVFAIRLDDRRAALWQTNLARVLESLTDIRPVPAPEGRYGWSLKKHHDPDFLELTRAGEWTIFSAAQEHNDLVGDLLARIRRGQSPLATENSNDWLEADLDPSRLAAVFSRSARAAGGAGRGEVGSKNIFAPNHFHLTVTDDGTNILAQGRADFPGPLALDLKPWNIPTNLIDEQLASLTLIRGFKPWLESSPAWNNLQIGPPPDQICFWALRGFPMESYFTAPLPEASNEVDRLTDWVLQNQSRWFEAGGPARFERSTTFNGLEWKGVPLVSPFLRSITVGNQNFVYGGGFPGSSVFPLSLKLLQTNLNRTNLVYHGWELTSERIQNWLFMAEFTRLICGKAQLPHDTAGMSWINAISPELHDSVTDVTRTAPNQLTFNRKSTIGFTGIELNLLVDWLESPQFPRGLYSLLTPPSS